MINKILDDLIQEAREYPDWEAVSALRCAKKELLKEIDFCGKWISVKDRLPEEEKLYLVFREEQPRMMVLEYNTEKKEFGWTDYPTCRWNKREGVTHWMPLPKPPKEG